MIDHLGLPQPFEPPPPAQPFADLPMVLALAAQPNVAIKITGACTLSHEPFPYPDLWEPLGRIFDAFGLERSIRPAAARSVESEQRRKDDYDDRSPCRVDR